LWGAANEGKTERIKPLSTDVINFLPVEQRVIGCLLRALELGTGREASVRLQSDSAVPDSLKRLRGVTGSRGETRKTRAKRSQVRKKLLHSMRALSNIEERKGERDSIAKKQRRIGKRNVDILLTEKLNRSGHRRGRQKRKRNETMILEPTLLLKIRNPNTRYSQQWLHCLKKGARRNLPWT